MHDRFESLESGEVISVQHEAQVLSGHRTFRAGELSDAIKSYLENAIGGWSEEKNGWFTDRGIDCEALRFGSNGWQKGRIRLCLEFCPDELNSVNHSSTSIPINATTELTGHPVSATLTPPHDPNTARDVRNENSVNQSTFAIEHPAPEIATNQHETMAAAGAGIAVMGAVGVAAIATPNPAQVATNLTIPPLADTVLELEEHHADLSASHSGNLDEIAFDFDQSNDSQGRMIPNGMMELDLNDLGLDFSEHDLLNFEANGMSDDSAEFANLQDIGRSENSGMLIDEVWNEMNQGNWPGIN